ncbi:hypothetical protein ABPG72_003050 [Tetrahymena utriculariae]
MHQYIQEEINDHSENPSPMTNQKNIKKEKPSLCVNKATFTVLQNRLKELSDNISITLSIKAQLMMDKNNEWENSNLYWLLANINQEKIKLDIFNQLSLNSKDDFRSDLDTILLKEKDKIFKEKERFDYNPLLFEQQEIDKIYDIMKKYLQSQ